MLVLLMQQCAASVAKWLRQRFVVPPFAGSSPVVRPSKSKLNPPPVKDWCTLTNYLSLLTH